MRPQAEGLSCSSTAGSFVSGDSRDPELAGVWSATVGSFYMLLVTLALSFPLGVGTAIYLEEFAPRNRWTDLIEVNINNLAAVPSIVFGLARVGACYQPCSVCPVLHPRRRAGLTLMTLPVIIIAARASLRLFRRRSEKPRWESAHLACRRLCTMCCRWRCRAC